MRYLIVTTLDESMRAEIQGWTHEDSEQSTQAQHENGYGMHVGFISSGRPPLGYPKTVVHAIGQGWRIMAPPTQYGDVWEWWLTQ